MNRVARHILRAALLGALAISTVAASACAGSIVKAEQDRELRPAEIKRMLRSDDFRKKNRAREQLGKLPEPERLALLVELCSDEDAATRSLALVELAKIDRPEARTEIERLAREDPDEDVRLVAQSLVEAPETDGGSVDAGDAPDAGA